MRYGVGPIPLRVGLRDKGGGLKLRMPRQFKEMKSETKTLGLLLFGGIFKRPRLKTRIAVPPHAKLPLSLKRLICPPACTHSLSQTFYTCGMYVSGLHKEPLHAATLSPPRRLFLKAQTSEEVLLYL